MTAQGHAGQRLASLRKKAGFSTQTAFAKHIQIEAPYLSQLETGKRQGSMELWANISDVLDVPIDYFWGRRRLQQSVPLDAELDEDGDLHGESITVQHTPPQALNRKGPTPDFERLSVDGAAEGWFAATVNLPAQAALELQGVPVVFPIITPGDILVFDPKAEPRHGDLVHGVWGRTEKSALFVYRVMEGDHVFLWPIAGDDPPQQLAGDWKVGAVCVELRRRRPAA